jgi:hypothetical protein
VTFRISSHMPVTLGVAHSAPRFTWRSISSATPLRFEQPRPEHCPVEHLLPIIE